MLSLLWSSTKDTIECDEAHSGGLFVTSHQLREKCRTEH